jgi:hypothetical protein
VYLVLIFLSGFSLAVPYYLPSSIFIVDLGGKKHCTSCTHVEHRWTFVTRNRLGMLCFVPYRDLFVYPSNTLVPTILLNLKAPDFPALTLPSPLPSTQAAC